MFLDKLVFSRFLRTLASTRKKPWKIPFKDLRVETFLSTSLPYLVALVWVADLMNFDAPGFKPLESIL